MATTMSKGDNSHIVTESVWVVILGGGPNITFNLAGFDAVKQPDEENTSQE